MESKSVFGPHLNLREVNKNTAVFKLFSAVKIKFNFLVSKKATDYISGIILRIK